MTNTETMTTLRAALDGDQTVPFETWKGWIRTDGCTVLRQEYQDVEYALIPHTGYGYGESALERSNRETVEDDMSTHDAPDGFYEQRDGSAMFRLDMPANEGVVGAAVDILRALADYIVLDDGLMSSMEWDDACEAWESYGRADIRRLVDKGLSLYEDTESVSDDSFDSLWRLFCENHCEGGVRNECDGSVYFFDDEAAEWMVAAIERNGRRMFATA